MLLATGFHLSYLALYAQRFQSRLVSDLGEVSVDCLDLASQAVVVSCFLRRLTWVLQYCVRKDPGRGGKGRSLM